MQDAQSKIGVERMDEMFDKIKQIKIPQKFIPLDLYQQYQSKIKESSYQKRRLLISCQ